MQEGNPAAGGDGICDFMHGVGAQDNAFGPRLLQPDRGLSKDLPGAIPVAGGLAGFDVVKIDAVQHRGLAECRPPSRALTPSLINR